MTYEQEKEYEKTLRKKFTVIRARVKKSLTKLAEKHDTKTFINKAPELIKKLKNIVESVDYDYYTLRTELSKKYQEIEKFNDDCWKYCQGDTRICL